MSKTNGAHPLAKLNKGQLLEVIAGYDASYDVLQETLADQQLALEDAGWQHLSGDGSLDMLTPDQIIRLIDACRMAYIMNPLIHHAVDVQANYVFGQGVSVRALPTEEVNDVLQTFWDERSNQKNLTSQSALWNLEVQLRTEANIFFVLFPHPLNGEVLVRTLPPEEIIRGGIIHNPNDKSEPWYYHRVWNEQEFDPVTGTLTNRVIMHDEYYPDMNYEPEFQVPEINGKRVNWETPIYHLKVGNLAGQAFGIPEIQSAMAWAKAVKLDLEDYATIRRALSRFAWSLRTKGGKKGVAQAKTKLQSALSTSTLKDTNPPPAAGSAFISDMDREMTPFKLAGTTLNPEEGRRLWLMVSAGTGIPETILAGNADVGNLATARTLDRPTELQMRNRQALWEGVIRDISLWVLGQSAKALLGGVTGDFLGGVLELRSRQTPGARGRPVMIRQRVSIEVNFPTILERNKKENVDAVVDAITLGGREPKGVFSMADIRRRLLGALAEADIDGAVATIIQEEKDGDPMPGPTKKDTQQPGTGEAQRPSGPSGRERVTNNEFVDEA